MSLVPISIEGSYSHCFSSAITYILITFQVCVCDRCTRGQSSPEEVASELAASLHSSARRCDRSWTQESIHRGTFLRWLRSGSNAKSVWPWPFWLKSSVLPSPQKVASAQKRKETGVTSRWRASFVPLPAPPQHPAWLFLQASASQHATPSVPASV